MTRPSKVMHWCWRSLGVRRIVLVCGLLNGSTVAAQDLPYLRDGPGAGVSRCPGLLPPPTPSVEEKSQAAELTSSSDQAVMLGDLSRAVALLDRAAELDPASAELAYRRARVLEDLAEAPAAVEEYCRALSLAPDEGIRDARTRLGARASLSRVIRPTVSRGATKLQ